MSDTPSHAAPVHTAQSRPDSLIDYPCLFPIKVMGLHQPDFAATVASIAQRHDPSFDQACVTLRPSKGGKYLGVTITVTATSRPQLDALYRELTSHPLVKVVL